MSLVLWLDASHAAAQSVAAASRQPPDSTVTKVVFEAIISTLTYYIASGVGDSSSSAWSIALPSDNSPVRWVRIDTELRRILRARPPASEDRRTQALTVEEVRVNGDSLVLEFTVSGRGRCASGEGWGGSATGYRLSLAWAYRTGDVRPQAFMFSDDMCFAPRPPQPDDATTYAWRPQWLVLEAACSGQGAVARARLNVGTPPTSFPHAPVC